MITIETLSKIERLSKDIKDIENRLNTLEQMKAFYTTFNAPNPPLMELKAFTNDMYKPNIFIMPLNIEQFFNDLIASANKERICLINSFKELTEKICSQY